MQQTSVASTRYKPLVLIPVYNHSNKIAAIVNTITHLSLPCLLIDDGSQTHCKQMLEKIRDDNPAQVSLIRHDVNQGKGAAVCDGILHAEQQNFSHVLQIDADGQHDLNDIPVFLNISQNNPVAVISGSRNYLQMPKSRRYGRKFTDLWVCINTLSNDIKDSMCGYRLYPVESSAKLVREHAIGKRMDFDTDIIVRLYWRAVPIKHIDTSIIYHDNIDSHFKLWADNLRITRMHTLLFFGMVLRMPILLYRKLLKTHL